MAQVKGQGLGDARQHADRLTEYMAKELGLNATQVERVSVINSVFAEKLFAASQEPAEERTFNKADETARRNEELKAVLTAEQFGKWKELESRQTTHAPDGQEIRSVEPVR